MLKPDQARRILAVIRLVNGGIALGAPRWFLRTIGVDPEANGAAVFVLRLFGVRNLYLGYELLAARGGEADDAVRAAVYIHASDASAAILAGLTGGLPARAALSGALTSSVNTALSILARSSLPSVGVQAGVEAVGGQARAEARPGLRRT